MRAGTSLRSPLLRVRRRPRTSELPVRGGEEVKLLLLLKHWGSLGAFRRGLAYLVHFPAFSSFSPRPARAPPRRSVSTYHACSSLASVFLSSPPRPSSVLSFRHVAVCSVSDAQGETVQITASLVRGSRRVRRTKVDSEDLGGRGEGEFWEGGRGWKGHPGSLGFCATCTAQFARHSRAARACFVLQRPAPGLL